MIIVRIMGGLGNQMFQYAAGKRLSMSHNTELKLDLRYFKKSRHRRYLLDHFSVPDQVLPEISLEAGSCQRVDIN